MAQVNGSMLLEKFDCSRTMREWPLEPFKATFGRWAGLWSFVIPKKSLIDGQSRTDIICQINLEWATSQ